MREIESILDGQSISKDKYIVIRCDGKGFSKKIEEANIKVPFDKDFHDRMVKAAMQTVRTIFDRGFAYTFSDEVSFVLPKEVFTKYGRRIEKLVSLAAGAMSGFGSIEFHYLDIIPTIFDGKIFEFSNIDEVMNYLSLRKTNCIRNFTFSVARHHYMKQGLKSDKVAKKLNGIKLKDLIEHLLKAGVDIYKLPVWQREGTIIYYEPYDKVVKKGSIGARSTETVLRRRLKTMKPQEFGAEVRKFLERGGFIKKGVDDKYEAC